MVVYRLLRSLQNHTAIEEAMRQILPELKSVSMKLELLGIVDTENMWVTLVSEIAAAEFEKCWRDEVRAKPADDLAKETDFILTFLVAKQEAEPGEPSYSPRAAACVGRPHRALWRCRRSQEPN